MKISIGGLFGKRFDAQKIAAAIRLIEFLDEIDEVPVGESVLVPELKFNLGKKRFRQEPHNVYREK